MAYLRKQDIQYLDSPNIDQFGRLRVSQVNTQLDIKYNIDDEPILVDEVLNGTGATTSVGNSRVTLNTLSSGEYVIRQTKARAHYQSGKSQQMFFTFSSFDNQTSVTKRIGYFTATTSAPYNTLQDGLYLENNGSEVRFVIGKAGTLTTISQTSWNVDNFDGDDDVDNPSGILIDWSKAQIAMLEYEWLGVGRVVLSFVIDGKIYRAHEQNHANGTITEPYMISPNQPLRWELRQDGATAGTFTTICATVGSEGAINEIGKVRSDNCDNNDLQLNSAGTLYAAGAIRLQSGKLDQVIDIVSFDYLAETNDRALWELRLNPTVTGTFAFTNVSNSGIASAFGNQTGGASPTVTGGDILLSGYVEQQGSRRIDLDSAIRLGAAIDGTPDEIVLCVKPINSGLDAYISFNWREL